MNNCSPYMDIHPTHPLLWQGELCFEPNRECRCMSAAFPRIKLSLRGKNITPNLQMFYKVNITCGLKKKNPEVTFSPLRISGQGLWMNICLCWAQRTFQKREKRNFSRIWRVEVGANPDTVVLTQLTLSERSSRSVVPKLTWITAPHSCFFLV